MEIITKQEILTNYQRVTERIGNAAVSVGRDPASVKLIVVTKGHPVEVVSRAIEAGLNVFGENYAEEGQTKKEALVGIQNLEWHMIGHIQSRKARLVVENYDWVHSLDSKKLARRLNRFAAERNVLLPVLVEFNVSGETSKYGFSADQEDSWPKLIEKIAPLTEFNNLNLRGLMTMAPFLPNPEGTRKYFQRLRRLRDYLIEQIPQADWNELSMGMSADFEVAVQEGATMVRIGTAIVGERN
jgi:pyridoxal phosphate enzyme (YggS family)